ncbi:hypothetical protein AGLY_014159 [Aphis glycines]|uniref:Uncharacterized protein n=1 Tax=Aphis glycines TaxID=307491 RepID=A0A6G0T6D0_APHGL|nr:hypothetical protein AGLY_014159 [Aphis glycines]
MLQREDFINITWPFFTKNISTRQGTVSANYHQVTNANVTLMELTILHKNGLNQTVVQYSSNQIDIIWPISSVEPLCFMTPLIEHFICSECGSGISFLCTKTDPRGQNLVLFTFDFDECFTASFGPIIVLGNFEKKNGSLGNLTLSGLYIINGCLYLLICYFTQTFQFYQLSNHCSDLHHSSSLLIYHNSAGYPNLDHSHLYIEQISLLEFFRNLYETRKKLILYQCFNYCLTRWTTVMSIIGNIISVLFSFIINWHVHFICLSHWDR